MDQAAAPLSCFWTMASLESLANEERITFASRSLATRDFALLHSV
jgi:hypothetical protein